MLFFTFFRLIKIKEWVDKHDAGAILIPFSGAYESRLVDMEEPERKAYMEEQKATRYFKAENITLTQLLRLI